MRQTLFYIGLAFQIIGFTSVGLCFAGGIQSGDYGKVELAQLIIGAVLFYGGHALRGSSQGNV